MVFANPGINWCLFLFWIMHKLMHIFNMNRMSWSRTYTVQYVFLYYLYTCHFFINFKCLFWFWLVKDFMLVLVVPCCADCNQVLCLIWTLQGKSKISCAWCLVWNFYNDQAFNRILIHEKNNFFCYLFMFIFSSDVHKYWCKLFNEHAQSVVGRHFSDLPALKSHYTERVALLYHNLSDCFHSTLHWKGRSFASQLFNCFKCTLYWKRCSLYLNSFKVVNVSILQGLTHFLCCRLFNLW